MGQEYNLASRPTGPQAPPTRREARGLVDEETKTPLVGIIAMLGTGTAPVLCRIPYDKTRKRKKGGHGVQKRD